MCDEREIQDNLLDLCLSNWTSFSKLGKTGVHEFCFVHDTLGLSIRTRKKSRKNLERNNSFISNSKCIVTYTTIFWKGTIEIAKF